MFKILLKIFGVLLLIGLVLGGTYTATLLGPKKVDRSSSLTRSTEKQEEAEALIERSRQLELEFDAFTNDREPTRAELDKLREAVALIDNARAITTFYEADLVDRQESMLATYQDGMARLLKADSEDEEQSAISFEKEGKIQEAQFAYRRAYNLQLRANSEFTGSRFVDVGRATRLSRKITSLEAEPIYRSSLENEEAARNAFEGGDWIQARQFLRMAILEQQRLNQEFRGTQQASMTRLSRLETLDVTYRSAQAYSQVEKRIKEAEELFALRSWEDAARVFDDARRRQRKINEAVPDSAYASTERVLELEGRRQSALSKPFYQEIIAGVALIDVALKQREVNAAIRTIQQISETSDLMRNDFPRHGHDLDEIVLKLAYLNVNQGRIPEIHQWVDTNSAPIPNRSNLRLANREVNQQLYTWIMGNNPSTYFGEELHVSSISFAEAQTFCQRLGWLLGAPVRLPSVEEYRLALGEVSLAEIVSSQRGLDDPATQPSGYGDANQYGFYNLLGNVAEWISATEVFGGDASMTPEQLVAVPVETIAVGTTSRLIGLRFLVEAP